VALPFLTADHPGIGGILRESAEDFVVIEEPAYPPAGTGDHVFAFVEKRDLTTSFAIGQIARALSVSARDIGYAGMKDRRAVTRQWISLPPPVQPAQVLDISIDGLRVLEAIPHPHKLRTGHLRSNRFELMVRGTGPDAAAVATAVIAALAIAPNWYGRQRFGRDGDNAAQGLALVRKERRFDRDPRKNRLLLSSLQSELFNRWLIERIRDGWYRQVLDGDVLRKASGGQFVSTDPAIDQPRLVAGEVVPTGPMFGVEMRSPPLNTTARIRETAVLIAAQIELQEFAPLRKLAPGARRDAAISIGDWSVESVAPDAIRVCFTLPAGAYATAVMRELQKNDEDATATDETSLDLPEPLKEQQWI
jgi:tRNA pseudouridine13 synthase